LLKLQTGLSGRWELGIATRLRSSEIVGVLDERQVMNGDMGTGNDEWKGYRSGLSYCH